MPPPTDKDWDDAVDVSGVETETALLGDRIGVALETTKGRLPIAISPADGMKLARVLLEALERFRAQR